MKKTLRLFSYFILFIFTFIVFLPKTNLYFFLEKNLKEYSVIIDNETIKEEIFSISINNGDIYFLNKKYASFDKIDISTFLFVNNISANDINLEEDTKKLFPYNILNSQIKYNIFSPTTITFDSVGDFGNVEGSFDLISQTLFITLKPSNEFQKKSREYLINMKNDKGVYTYEYKL